MDCSTPGFLVHHQLPGLLKLMSMKSVMPSNQLILCCLLFLLTSVFPSFRIFSASQFFVSGGQVLECQLQHQSFQGIFRTDFLQDGLVGSPCSPRDSQESSPTPQFRSINSSILSFLCSPTLTSIHDYWKSHTLTRWTFVGKVMSLLFNKLSRLVITFLPRSKHLLISWLQSPFSVIFEPPKIKFLTVSIVSPSMSCSNGTRWLDLSFLNVEF